MSYTRTDESINERFGIVNGVYGHGVYGHPDGEAITRRPMGSARKGAVPNETSPNFVRALPPMNR